jgi:protein-arginine kinase activator protein McsA
MEFLKGRKGFFEGQREELNDMKHLKAQLEKAVELQEYEKAAKLRDKISELEKK